MRDARSRPAASVRDTIPLKVAGDVAGQVVQKSVQYDTGVTLAPGKYTLRFVARENGEGKLGTFETPFTVPDLSASSPALHVSSMILSDQRNPIADQVGGVKNSQKLLANNPLIQNGQKLVPNVTRVFPEGKNMLVYAEVYDPKIPDGRADVAASLALYSHNRKVFETPPVQVTRLSDKRDSTVPVWLHAPTSSLKPGRYQCQINLIDEFGRKFAFPRSALAIAPAIR